MEPLSARELCLLSLDGGGVRGVSTLFILRELMRAIDNDNPPKPCEVFDMIGGTSTGGLIAIMLGRLEMSVDECIDAYQELSKTVFTKQSKSGWRANLQGRFSSNSLEKAIKKVLQRKNIDIDAHLKEKSSDLCRTFVCATDARRSQTIPLRSYAIDEKINYECTIWEAARATSAASTFFDSITVGDRTYVDGGIGNNNPINQVLAEASGVWSQDSLFHDVKCIVSLGTGFETDLPFGISSSASFGNASGVFKALAAIATESNMTANAFEARFPGLPYFRFNVPGIKDIGLREHEKILEISAKTLEYLNERTLSFQRCAFRLKRESDGMNFPSLNNSGILGRSGTTFVSFEGPFLRYSLEYNPADSGYASSESTSHLDLFQEEFVELIFNHNDFARLLDIAANKMVFQEFQNSFSVLLKQYAVAVEEPGIIPIEKDTADFIRTRCQHITRALWVQVQSMTEERGEENVNADEEIMRESKQALMNKFLKDFGAVDQTQPSEIPVPGDDTFGSMDSVTIDEDRWKSLPALEKVRGFLTTHKAFKELLVKFEYVVHGSLLHLAIFNDDGLTVSQLLENSTSVNIKDIHGVSALSLALDLAQRRHGLHDPHYRVLRNMLLRAATDQQPMDIVDESLICFIPWTEGAPSPKSSPRETIICDCEISQVLDRLQETLQSPLSDNGGELLKKLGNTVVVSGSGETFQATTCRAYIEGYHSEMGRAILCAIVEAYCGIKQLSVADTTDRGAIFAIEVPMMTPNHITLSLDELDDVERFYAVRILIWLCKAIRLPPFLGTSDAKMHLSIAQQFDPDWCNKELGCLDKRVAWYTLKPPEEFNVTESNCWIHLFGAGIVAEHQLSRRDWVLARGLEIPFEILVNLAAAENYTWVEDSSEDTLDGTDSSMTGGYILLGFYTALIPTASNEARDCIQWHFEFNETHILHPTNLQTPRTQWLHISDPNLFGKSKCFVGWCGKANVMVGTRDLRNTVEWSDLHTRSRTLHTKGFTATVQASGTAGLTQFAAQGAQNLEYVTNRQHFAATTAYDKAIVEISRQVALVYDSETQQAWLLPKLSVLLHLCHTYFLFFKDANDPPEDPVPFADASVDGSQAARTALTSKGAIVVTGGIQLHQILVDINVNITDSGKTRESPKRLMLFGSELMDMLLKPGTGSDLAEVKTSPPAEAWIRLVQYADAILVCSKLGQALTPIPDVPLPGSPCDCTHLPARRCYLAAHIWCLEMMLQRRNCHVKNLQDQVLKINEDTVWCLNGRPFNQCPHNANEHYWDNSKEVLQKVSKPRDKVSVTPSIYPVPISGALVFGIPPPKVLRKKAP